MKSIHLLAAGFAILGAAFFPSSASGAVYDLSTQSTVVVNTSYGSAIFTTDFTQPTGTGVFDPFLTIQGNGVEQGYNTSKGVFDTKREPQWNHEIRVSDLEQSKVTINGVQYYTFLLDINEPNNFLQSKISLDALKIYTSTKAGQTTTNVDSLGVKRFDLDMPKDNYIVYDDRNSGSGQSDIAIFIPVSAFIGASPTDYVYMYQKFGTYHSANTNLLSGGGFEETRIGVGVMPIPEVSTFLPLIGVLGAVVGFHHFRRRRQTAE